MPLNDPISPLLEQFAAAGRLLNEWRDTIYYSLVAAYAVIELAHRGLLVATMAFLFFMNLREAARQFAWQRHRQEAVAGPTSIRINKEKNAASAGAVWTASLATSLGIYNTALIVHGQSAPSTLIGASIFLLAASTKFAFDVGGPAEIIKTYREIMFDYPRKKGGGGGGQTQKLIQGFKDLGARLGAAVGGRPAPQPTGIVPHPAFLAENRP